VELQEILDRPCIGFTQHASCLKTDQGVIVFSRGPLREVAEIELAYHGYKLAETEMPDEPTEDSEYDPGTPQVIPSRDELAKYRAKEECYELASAVARQWPHLRQDAGFYVRPRLGPGDHSWNVAPDGTIVDTTSGQHPGPEIVPPDHPHYQRYVSWASGGPAQTLAHQLGYHEGESSEVNPSCPECNPSRISSTPQVMYHVAPSDSRDSILQYGLDHARGADASIEAPEGNYLWGDEHSAHDYAAMKYFDFHVPYDVWRVRHEGLPLVGDPYLGSPPEDAAMTTQPISPDRLELMDPSQWAYESYYAPGANVPNTRRRTIGMRRITPPPTDESPFYPYEGEGPFYHGTNALLNPGDVVQPASEIGHPGNFSEVEGVRNQSYHPTMAYAHVDPDQAGLYGGDQANVYRVEPTGPIYEDPENFLPGGKAGTSLMSSGWRVVEPIPPERIRRIAVQRRESAIKTADWNDIMEKAKRLIQGNQVILLRNGTTNIVGTVQGDHGQYEVEIGRQDPESRVITNWHCFLPDAPVTMADGTRRAIKDIGVGDHVLTHEGNSRAVLTHWSKPYRGRLATIKLQGVDEPIVCTEDHQFWSANDDYYLQDCVGWRGKIKLGEGPLNPRFGWEQANKLQAGGYLSSTPIQEEETCVIAGVTIDEDMGTVLGWYAAEGFVIKATKNRIGFSMHRDERPIAKKLSEIIERKFGTPGTIRMNTWPGTDRMDTTDFRVSDGGLRALVTEAVGTGSHLKQLHPSLLRAPLAVQRAFIDAYVAGDGHVDGNRTSIITTSGSMAHQLRLILDRLGHATSLTWNDENSGNGFVKNWRRIYRVRWATGARCNPRFVRDGKSWYKIESVTFEDYDGPVFDMEVEEDHSFRVYGVNVHNCQCPWAQFSFDRTRKWKKYEQRPCSHVLALYWKSLSAPVDDDDEQQGPSGQPAPAPGGPPGLPGQPGGPPGPGAPKGGPAPAPAPIGVREAPSGPRTFMPNGDMFPADQGQQPLPGMPPAQQAQPQQRAQPQGVIPPFPGQQMQLWEQWQGPGTTDGGQPSPPWAVSVPGAKPTSPFNPVQSPGTYSKFVWAAQYQNGQIVQLMEDEYMQEQGGAGQYVLVTARRPDGSPRTGEVQAQDEMTGWTEVMFSMDDNGPGEARFAIGYLDPGQVRPSQQLPPGQTGPRRVYK
jgi:hypothetical protein